MSEVMIIFSMTGAGCWVRLATDLVLQYFARRASRSTVVGGPGKGPSPKSQPTPDPLVALSVTLTFYGAIALLVVSALPGTLATERTVLAFALMCAGGLIAEISRTGRRPDHSELDTGALEPKESTRRSMGLSVALMLALNLAVAVIAGRQGLIQVVPPPATASDAQAELEQIVVVARREPSDGRDSTFL